MEIGANSPPQGTVTFLFTDIEGSTGLLRQLGRERYRDLLGKHRELLREAILDAGGVEVDAQGDSVLAAFASADGATSAAVSAQHAFHDHRFEPQGSRVRVRMGLHTGEAVLTAEGYVGLAVHRGRRVCEAAHGGQIVASNATRALIESELPAGVRLSDLGEFRLAGFDAPEQLFQLVIDGLPAVFPDLRAVQAWREERVVLLERAREVADLDAVLAGCRAEAGSLAVIEGSAGVGKSSLLAEGCARAADARMEVLRARGTELEASFSYGVVRQLFEGLVAQANATERADLFGGAAVHAARLFEAEGLLGTARASEDEALALQHGLYWLAVNLADSRPIVIAIDDLQWADASSLRWLSYLVGRLGGIRVCALAAVRPLADEDPLLTQLLTDPGTKVVRPTALTLAGVTELVQGRLSSEAEPDFCRACHDATGGNPLLIHELVRTLAAEGVTPTAAAASMVERIAPDAVSRSVRLRLARLPAEAVRVAYAVAILGDDVADKYVADMAAVERPALASAAATLARLELLRPDPPFRFVHPLVRTAVYKEIPAEARAKEHARAAAILASALAPTNLVSAQLLVAPPESVDGAVAVLRKAAAEAAGEGASESAVQYLLRALEEPTPADERADLLLELAANEFRFGAPTVAEHLSEAVSLLPDPDSRSRAALELGRALSWSGQPAEAVRAFEDGLSGLPRSSDLRYRLEAELIANAITLPSLHTTAASRLDGLEVDATQGPGSRLILGLQAYLAAARGTYREQATESARHALSETPLPEEERVYGYDAAIGVLLFADHLDEGTRLLDASIAEARRRGAVISVSNALMFRAHFGYARGALDEAEADARIAIEALPHHNVDFLPRAYACLTQVLVERGAIEEASEFLTRAEVAIGPVGDNSRYASSYGHACLQLARSVATSAQGDNHATLASATIAGRLLTEIDHLNPGITNPGWRSQAALAQRALGATDDALQLACEEVELAQQWGAPRALGRALRVLGLIEGGERGIERLHEATAVLESSPAKLEYGYALTELGAALRRHNHRAEARDHLRLALELAQHTGAKLLAGRAHEELIASGARPRRLVRSGVEALTPSELRVAKMAADGSSNREIAQALFVTPRTVEMHLSNAFRKLDVSSRTQLPALLANDR